MILYKLIPLIVILYTTGRISSSTEPHFPAHTPIKIKSFICLFVIIKLLVIMHFKGLYFLWLVISLTQTSAPTKIVNKRSFQQIKRD